MKFLADMGISPKTVTFLHGLGYGAIHLHDEGLDRLPDPDILEKARLEGFVLLTSDLDFGELLAMSRTALPSVVLFRLGDMRSESVNAYLTDVLNRFSVELEAGAVIVVTEGKIRVRRLPIG